MASVNERAELLNRKAKQVTEAIADTLVDMRNAGQAALGDNGARAIHSIIAQALIQSEEDGYDRAMAHVQHVIENQ